MGKTVEDALMLALDALIEVEYVAGHCAWCKTLQTRSHHHLEGCARHAALVAIHEARVEINRSVTHE